MARFYLDHNATTPVLPEALEAYRRAIVDTPGNPSSLHDSGRRARAALEAAREEVADLLMSADDEVVFTSGGTESNNLALLGAVRAREREGEEVRIVSSHAEHPSVLEPLRLLQQEGASLRLTDPRPGIVVEAEKLVLDPASSLVVMQWANSETGALQPVDELAELLPDETHWHCDAVQGWGRLPWNRALARADTLTFSGHKFGAPVGVGVLRIRSEARVDPIMVGGQQQHRLRAGTESVALAVALATAMRLSVERQASTATALQAATRRIEQELLRRFPEARANHPAARLPNTLSLCLRGVDGRQILPAFDTDGLEASQGSACSSGSPRPSPALVASGLSEPEAQTSVRLSLGAPISCGKVEEMIHRLSRCIERLYHIANNNPPS